MDILQEVAHGPMQDPARSFGQGRGMESARKALAGRLDPDHARSAKTAVDGISFEVCPNEIVGLLGPNGAGKSTLLKILAGVVQPGSGNVTAGFHTAAGYYAQHQWEQLNPGEMMAVQVKMGLAQQEIEYTSTLLSKVIQSITQIINTQL